MVESPIVPTRYLYDPNGVRNDSLSVCGGNTRIPLNAAFRSITVVIPTPVCPSDSSTLPMFGRMATGFSARQSFTSMMAHKSLIGLCGFFLFMRKTGAP